MIPGPFPLASTPLSLLPLAATLTGAELVFITQGGQSVQCTILQILQLIATAGLGVAFVGDPVSEFSNDAQYAIGNGSNNISQFNNDANYATGNGSPNVCAYPGDNVSEFFNDVPYATGNGSTNVCAYPSDAVGEFTDDGTYLSVAGTSTIVSWLTSIGGIPNQTQVPVTLVGVLNGIVVSLS